MSSESCVSKVRLPNRLRFTLQGLVWFVTVAAVALGVGRALGLPRTIALVQIIAPWVLLSAQIWRATKPGPKSAGISAVISIALFKAILWASSGESSHWINMFRALCILACIVVWLYISVRAIVVWRSPDRELGALSLFWIFDGDVLRCLESVELLVCSTLNCTVGVRPFHELAQSVRAVKSMLLK